MTVKNEINAPNVVKTNQMKVISESIIRVHNKIHTGEKP